MTKYTEEITEFIRNNHKGVPVKELRQTVSEKFGLNVSFCAFRTFLKKMHFKNGRDTRFVKGHPSFNKGLKQVDYMSEESIAKNAATRFQKGKIVNNCNFNYKPVGTTKYVKDGYVAVRVADPLGKPGARFWKFKHHLVWEQAHGPIPKGHAVLFKDGNKENFELSNLELVNHRTLLMLNQYKLIFKGLPELTEVGLKIAELKGKEAILKKSKRGGTNG